MISKSVPFIIVNRKTLCPLKSLYENDNKYIQLLLVLLFSVLNQL